MRLAICYSSKNQLELTEQTLPRVMNTIPRAVVASLIWCDGSTEEKAKAFFESQSQDSRDQWVDGAREQRVFGGADAAIAWKLTKALAARPKYTHIMLLENDVLLDDDWFEPTIALFDKGRHEGLEVGAVSPRSYVDRILFQRDGYAVMHNIGAGAIIFARDAAEIVLRTFRTHWWPATRYAFALTSGIDIGTYACFAGNQQWTTTDWGFEYQLLRYGMCALALTPARCEMIGQNPPLAEQGLSLTRSDMHPDRRNDEKFSWFVEMTKAIRYAKVSFSSPAWECHTQMGAPLFFPHQVGKLFAQQQGWRLKWTQGWGPFSYVAGPGGASLSVRVAGSCSFLLSGGVDLGANVSIVDTHSGYKAQPQLPPFQGDFVEVSVPGGFVPRTIALGLSEGGIFYGVNCADSQVLDALYSFDWTKLPEV